MNTNEISLSTMLRIRSEYSKKDVDIICGNANPDNTDLFKVYHLALSKNDDEVLTLLINQYDYSFLNNNSLPAVSSEYLENTLKSIFPDYKLIPSDKAKKKNKKPS